MFSKEAPLLFRPQWPVGEGWQQYRWSLRFLAECNDAAFHRNVGHIVALGAYSHLALKELVAQTGIDYHRLERGIAHFFADQAAFDLAMSSEENKATGKDVMAFAKDIVSLMVAKC